MAKQGASVGKKPKARSEIYAASTAVPQPATRPLKVYAFDPSAGRLMGNIMTISLNYEKLGPGPVGRKLAVVDYDGSNKTYYKPVDLDDPRILIQAGIDPTESDPRFHQQMVYAVASETLERFESALGRQIHWRISEAEARGEKDAHDGIRTLLLFPHAMYQANAFYSPKARGILFGYFRASTTHPGRNLPGQTVFTCLSHDIIAHETTHAIIDGIRKYFTEPTNVDVPAFHEAFADLAALFQHFSHKEVLLDTLQKTGGLLYPDYVRSEASMAEGDRHNGAGNGSKRPAIQADIAGPNPLIQLAQQFGEATGLRSGLRSALATPPNSDDIKEKMEPHDRGSILVAAVFDAYFTIYLRRTANLFKIFRAGGGSIHQQDLPGPLAEMLASEASKAASDFFIVCARALDYCPPVDITFGDFLRALITAHYEADPADPEGIREAFMDAFRSRGIVAASAKFFSEDALLWDRVAPDALPPVKDLVFGDPNGLTFDEKETNGDLLREYIRTYGDKLGFDMSQGGEDIEVPSFHPAFRIEPDGGLKVNMIVEAVQTRFAKLDEDNEALGDFPIRGGVTLLIAQRPIDEHGRRPDPCVSYVVYNHITPERERRQRTNYFASGMVGHHHCGPSHDHHAHLAPEDAESRFQIDFGLIHGGV
jgi:hypothetical protein